MAARAALGECAALVRRHDPHYLCAALLPPEAAGAAGPGARAKAFALRAFAVEVRLAARRKETLALMRLAWWRDAVHKAYRGQAPDHPVARALGALCAAGDGSPRLSKGWFTRIVSQREKAAAGEAIQADLDALEAFAEGTASPLLYLQLEAAGVKDPAAHHAASHLGKAAGLSLLLRGTVEHVQRKELYLPQDLCREHGVDVEALYRGEVGDGLNEVVWRVASRAKVHLDEARALAAGVPAGAVPLLWPAIPVSHHLSALEANAFNPLTEAMLTEDRGVSALRLNADFAWKRLWNKY